MLLGNYDAQLSDLVNEVSNFSKIDDFNSAVKSKIAFSLTKISIGLKLVNKILYFYELQDKIDQKLYTEENINDMSVRELLVTNSIINKRIDNSYNKLNNIIQSMNLKELESSILILQRLESMPTKEELGDGKEKGNMRNIALDVIRNIGSIKESNDRINASKVQITEEAADDLIEDQFDIDDDLKDVAKLEG